MALSRSYMKADVSEWAPNTPEWILLQLGVGLPAGLVMVPLNPAYRRVELSYALRQPKAAGIFYVPEYRRSPMAEWVRETQEELPSLRSEIELTDWGDFVASGSSQQKLPEVHPLDRVQIQYTSGTTGAPKGATLHHRGLTNNGRFVVSSLGARAGEAFFNPAPLFHVASCVVGVLGSLACRATLVQPVAFDPCLALALCAQERVTTMGGVPTMLIAMMEHPDFAERDLSAFRSVGIGGGENIYPCEIEEVLHTHAAVGDVAVVGVPDEKWGERVVAFIRLAPDTATQVTHDALEDEFRTLVRRDLAPHKTQREWFFLDELPTTASGKIQKFSLRDRYIEEHS